MACRCLLELHAIAAKKAEGGGEFDVTMTSTERLRIAGCSKADLEEFYNMLTIINVEAGDFYSCCKPSTRDDFKQHYEMSTAFFAAHTARLDDPGADDGARVRFQFRSSEMVANVFKEWWDEELRKRIVTLQEAGKHAKAMQWNEMSMRAVPEEHALNNTATGAAAAENSS